MNHTTRFGITSALADGVRAAAKNDKAGVISAIQNALESMGVESLHIEDSATKVAKATA